MKQNRVLISLLIALVLTLSVVVFAQANRPCRNDTVWSIGYIRMKPGMETAYLNYIVGDWKREQEAMKKDGQIISYKILQAEAHGTTDFNKGCPVEPALAHARTTDLRSHPIESRYVKPTAAS